MTDYAALATNAVDYMTANNSAVLANQGAAYAENKILRALNGVESTSLTLFEYAQQAIMLRSVPTIDNRADAYNFTHAVFFGTDMGRVTVSGIDTAGYGSAIDAACTTYATDYDVLAEMLISAKCIGHWSSACDTALSAFVDYFNSVDRNSDQFNSNYHVILVGGLLFSMMS